MVFPTNTVAYADCLRLFTGYKRIEVYGGVGDGNQHQYAHQRPCVLVRCGGWQRESRLTSTVQFFSRLIRLEG